jgi:hypothetical protein
MPDSTGAIAAADAWARDHGCRSINHCSTPPRESFQAGWDAAVATMADTRWRDDTRENTCGDPACPGGQAHAPDQARPLPAWTPAERDAVLARTYGRH